MSALTLNPVNVTETTHKDKAKKNPEKSKPALSYEEALKVMKECDVLIKEAGKSRTSKPEIVLDSLIDHYLKKGMIITGAAAATDAGLALAGVLPAGMEGPGMFVGILIAGLFGIGLPTFSPRLIRILSPLKAKKLQEKYVVDKALFDLKEAEFAEAEAKVLKKAKKAIKILNEQLKYENRRVDYCNIRRIEGFRIQDIGPMDSWDTELLKLEKAKITTPLEIEAGSQKTLTANGG